MTNRRQILAALLFILGGCASQYPDDAATAPRSPTTQAGRDDTSISAEPVEQELSRPVSPDSALAILLHTDVFADAYVGYAGTKSVQVEALQLLAQPDALDLFSDLLRRGHTAGKLYALCGLRLLAPAKYAEAEPPFLTSDEEVLEQSGSIMMKRPVKEFVRSSAPLTVRLEPGEKI